MRVRRNRFAMTSCALALLLVLPAAAVNGTEKPAPAASEHQIDLKSRSFTPEGGVDEQGIRRGSGPRDDVHFLMQFETLPNAEDRDAVAAQGFELHKYLSGNAYLAVASAGDLDRLDEVEGLRWAGPLEVDDKISPSLRRGEIGSWARAGRGRIVVEVTGHADVPTGTIAEIVEQGSGEVVGSSSMLNLITAEIAPGQVRALAREDAVQYVSVVEPALEGLNDDVRDATGAEVLNDAPYGLDGSGVTVLVFDGGRIDSTHPDFAGRVLETDSSSQSGHATHVAGTVLGDGSNSDQDGNTGDPGQWAGMAPAAQLRSFGLEGSSDVLYNDPGDIQADYTTAIGNGIDVSNQSLGNNVVRNGFPCGQLGDYTATSILLDQIMRGSIDGQQLVHFQAAGNERQSGSPCGTYSTIGSPATAKNLIAVGAINADDDSITGFTSYGPTDDGRLKPDIVAPGCKTTGQIISTEPGTGYGGRCGTSMASPAATGTTALLLEQWKSQYGATSNPAHHTAKAILLHTAEDLGRPGPDFQFGHGALRGQAAVDLVIADNSDDLVHVDSLDQDEEQFWTFNSDGSDDVQVTLTWSDPEATQLADPTLINDLDLRLIAPDGTVHEPFVLDPDNPTDDATTGNDDLNNVEVVVGDAAAGTWTAHVDATAVPEGPQEFTLVTPEDATINQKPEADAGGPYETDEGVDVTLDASGSSDPDGDSLTYEWDLTGNGDFTDATGASVTYDLVGFRGTYDVAVRVTDTDGAFDVDETTVTVNNVAPTVDEVTLNSPIDEGETLTVSGSASDAGWLTDLGSSVDWGDDAVPDGTFTGTTTENVRPDATHEFSGSTIYGDNGTFTVEVCASDGLATTCGTAVATVDNVDPTVVIDDSGEVAYGGQTANMLPAGDELTMSGQATDPGSDDLTLTWDWGDDDSTTTDYLNDLLVGADPFPSPHVNPRDVTDTQSHTYLEACLYTLTFEAVDDDGGVDSDDATVFVTGNAERRRGHGWWHGQYRSQPPNNFSDATLQCYLDMTVYFSLVFNDPLVREDAEDILRSPAKAPAEVQFDEKLLAAWLNLADGALTFDTLVDTDGDGIVDTTFGDALLTAEQVRNDPNATEEELREQRDILQRIIEADG